MTKRIIVLTLIALLCSELSAISKKGTLLTEKYAGKYSYGSLKEPGSCGEIIIYPETDSTVLFYLSVNSGEPSYNMGSIYGRLKISNGGGVFYKKEDYSETSCKWSLKFSGNKLTIKTIDHQDECGFGGHTYSDGTFELKKKGIIEYFKDERGKKVYFKDTKPENY